MCWEEIYIPIISTILILVFVLIFVAYPIWRNKKSINLSETVNLDSGKTVVIVCYSKRTVDKIIENMENRRFKLLSIDSPSFMNPIYHITFQKK
jgi:hypothetical protein